jgi:hypothetical protein
MYSTQSSHLLMHGLGHRFPQMGDGVYGEFAERMVSIVFGRGQPPLPAADRVAAAAPVPAPVPALAPESQAVAGLPQASQLAFVNE